MALVEQFKGVSGAYYRLNPFGGDKYTYAKYSNKEASFSSWMGPATYIEAMSDFDGDRLEKPKSSTVIVTHPSGIDKYNINEMGLTESGESITQIIHVCQSEHGFENVDIKTISQ